MTKIKRYTKKDQAEFKKRAKFLEKIGVYHPKDLSPSPAKISRVNALWREWSPLYDNPKIKFVSVADYTPASREKAIKTASELGMKSTPSGFFFETQGNRSVKIGKTKAGDFYVEQSGKLKTGPRRGHYIKTRAPLLSVDRIAYEKQRMQNVMDGMGPLKRGEQYRFTIVDKHGSHRSRFSFDDYDALMHILKNQYLSSRNLHGQVQLLTHIEIHKERAPKTRSRRR